MGAIFLSYAREDQACAEALAQVFEGAGHQVWWDRRIESGSEFAAEIEAALEAADAVVVLWSAHSIRSRWVRDEAAIGGDSGRLVPVVIDGAQPPIGFRQFQALDLSGWKGARKDARTSELLRVIGRRLESAEGEELATPPGAATRRPVWLAGRRRWAIAVALVLMIAAASIVIVLINRGQQRGPSKPTIALAPFVTTAADAELSVLARQARESVSHMLSQSGVPVRLLNSAPQGGKPSGDYLVSGEMSRRSDKIVATVRLDHTGHQLTVFSRRFEAGRDEVQDFPERIGAQIAGSITWAVPLIMLEERHPSDPAVTADLFSQLDFTGSFDTARAYQAAQRAVARAPDSAFAQTSLAFNTAFALDELPRQERPAAVAAARRAAERAKALAPEFGDTHAAWCFLHPETRMAECEDRIRAGRRIDPDAPFLDTFLGNFLRGVGRFDEAVELTRLSYAHDPYVPTKLGWMLRALEYAGDEQEASDLYQQGVRWWPEFHRDFFVNRLIGRIDRGGFEAIGRLEKELGSKGLPSEYRDSGSLLAAIKSKSPAGVYRFCADAKSFPLIARCFAAYAAVGDLDRAYALAAELYPVRVGRTPAETERIWLDDPSGSAPLSLITSPAAAPLRHDPRYLALAQRVGLLAYWRSGRAPDFCRKQPEPICAELLKRQSN